MIISMFGFSVLMAFIAAELEIQIEGKDGWAKNLPTWKVKNSLTRFIWGEQPITGYHVWFLLFNLVWSQFPFVVGVPWTLGLELQILSIMFFAILMEDFFWFVLNPEFGFKKFNAKHATWHLRWMFGVPTWYIKLTLVIIALLLVGGFLD
ncbi:MAG: hypothetical protein AAB599_02845 [Patescibacteria group bacterium]